MRSRRPFQSPSLLLLATLSIVALAGDAQAARYTWTQPGCGFFACNWSTAAYWTGGPGTPGAGDSALIAEPTPVIMTGNVGALVGLTLENGARLQTRGYSLSVGGSGANTFLFGTGTTGGNTSLMVHDGAPLGFDFVGFFLSLHQGAELRMLGGGAIVSFGINVSQSSLIAGYGTVFALAGSTRFDVAGTIRPEGGDLRLVSFAPGILDLDGNVGGVEYGQIEVVGNGDLSVEGSLADPFSGVMEIANRNTVEFDTALEFDGLLRFTSGIANHLVAPTIDFGVGAEVSVDQAIGWIDAVTTWSPSTAIELVRSTDELHLVGHSLFGSTTQFSGRGLLINDESSTMTLEDGTNMSIALMNEGELVIGNGEAAHVAIADFEQTPSGVLTVELGVGLPGVDFDRVSIDDRAIFAGALDVRFAPGFQIESGQMFEIIDVGRTSSGEFEDLPEGGTYGVYGGEPLWISYQGGDGNDVVLYVPEPGTSLALVFGVVGLAGFGRRGPRSRAGASPLRVR